MQLKLGTLELNQYAILLLLRTNIRIINVVHSTRTWIITKLNWFCMWIKVRAEHFRTHSNFCIFGDTRGEQNCKIQQDTEFWMTFLRVTVHIFPLLISALTTEKSMQDIYLYRMPESPIKTLRIFSSILAKETQNFRFSRIFQL